MILFQDYHDTIVKVTSETPLNEPVIYKVRDIANKMAILDREVKYLLNKAKIWRPKQEPATNNTEETSEEKPKKKTEPEIIPDAEVDTTKSEKPEDSESAESIGDQLELPESDTTQAREEKIDEELHQEL